MNILLILTEDQGTQVGYLGTPGVKTPHMDSLAQTAVVFEQAFVVYPVCSASKAALYTGMYNHANGILNNTLNYHKQRAEITEVEKNVPLYKRNRIKAEVTTLTEILSKAGYWQGVMHKIHVTPAEKFPYDEFLPNPSQRAATEFIRRAQATQKPWFLLYNIPNSHRPYPNSDKKPIRVKPEEVTLPSYLPDTPEVRKDWAEYLAGIEEADVLTGGALAALKETNTERETLVIFLGDHGPSFQHGKMSLYDLGLRTPLMIRPPGNAKPIRTKALVSTVDLLPTILDYVGIPTPSGIHGKSLRLLIENKPGATGSEAVFAEISHLGPLPNTGMQERCVFDGRYRLIYREGPPKAWRQVPADNKDPKPWGNRTYNETVRVKEQFPLAFRVLQEMDPQSFGITLPRFELYDTKADPDELTNLAENSTHRAALQRLYSLIQAWVRQTKDPAVKVSPL
ncbi:sulfatase [Armatimonas sp.]|uniref:sulfatase family protein n=1 Tax=Armatimonas sp. TaxID=1872638 RepID=UPI00374FE69F